MMAFVIKSIRSMFFSLDKIIYGLIDDVYSLLLTISRTSIFDDATIAEFASRIYAIAGIFMLFKVSLSIIEYVINPDSFIDKEKGFAALGKRIVISLALLVLTPYIFQEAYILQSLILEENTIMNLIFGTNSINNIPTDDYALNAGKNIQFTVMYAFMQPNYEEFYVDNDEGVNLSACELTYDPNNYTREDSAFIRALNPECFGTYHSDGDYYGGENDGSLPKAFYEYADNDDGLGAYQNYAQGVAQQDFNLMMRQDIVLIKDEHNTYIINYKYGISTAVGVAIVYIFLLFCIDIAIRSVKLGFLEMIAPIPILSYIEPKGKDGMFKKWYQMCISTYISLFLRLFALYLGVYAITVIGGFTDFVTGEAITGNWLLNVFMIVGVLMFAKQLPDIISKIFDTKLDGKFKLNPFKRFEEDAILGKQILGTGAAGLAGVAAFGTNLIAKKGNPLSAVAGAVSATGRGLVGAAKGEKFGKNFTSSYGDAMKARQDRDDRRELGVNAFNIASQRAKQAMGISTTDQIQDVQIKRYEEAINAGKAAKTRAESEIDKKADMIDLGGGVTLGALRDEVDVWKNTDARQYATTHGMTYDDAVREIASRTSRANSAYFSARKTATNEYIKAASEGNLTSAFKDLTGAGVYSQEDAIVKENVRQMTSAVDKYKLEDANGKKVKVETSKLGDSIQILEDQKTTIQASDRYRTAHLVATQTKKQK